MQMQLGMTQLGMTQYHECLQNILHYDTITLH